MSRPKPAQADGVPILVGGHSEAAARRAGRLGDGFFPLGVFGEELDALLKTMHEAAREAGRDPETIEITTVGAPDAAVIEGFMRQGVDRVLISPSTGDLGEMRSSLEKFQREVAEGFSE